MTDAPALRARGLALLHRVEDAIVFAVFMGVILLPLVDAVGRPFGGFHVPGGATYLRHGVLWLSFLGGLLATRERKHLQLSTTEFLPEGKARRALRAVVYGASAGIAALLAKASWAVVAVNRETAETLTVGVPEWVSELVMPVGLGLIALRFVLQAGETWAARLTALAVAPVGFLLVYAPDGVLEHLFWPGVGAILAVAVFGAPVFIAMAGIAMLAFFDDGTPIVAMPLEIYRLIGSPTIPAIPLLTVCGYVLAESKASERLVRLFRALFGWMPGGVAVLVAAVCAVFTAFTGGSGVTIIALGGLVYGILRDGDYPERFSLGLVTASGSLGLLFPPSLPVILYAVVVSSSEDFSVAAEDLYIAGIVPGVLLVALVALYGVWMGRKVEKNRPRFDARELLASLWESKWELSVPIIVIGLFVTGVASMVEAAAAAALYSVVVECFVTRDIHWRRDLPRVMAQAGVLVGAVLILLAAAFGLSYYVVAEALLPETMLEWVTAHIEQPWVFLLALNGLLLLLGAFLEIYSAIVIIPPVLAPLAAHFGIDPVHLGIIFLANLELGFISPPVGLNLFLAASRFEKPMVTLYRSVVPYLLILAVGVLLITYVPALSTGVVELLKPD
ncbi:MAG: TRAP transporter large permease subunit [Myxococcales bacterium]|nr:TRAP transporter large permease subunit [Myxococcales bacterium]MCB9535147.1 TRAP transporter large permease subunit [Myxococcales bacterium]